MADFIEVCALWSNTSRKDGKKYLAGSFGPNNKIMIFPNQHKKEDKHPDYRMFIVKREKKEEQSPSNLQPSLLDEEPALDESGQVIPF